MQNIPRLENTYMLDRLPVRISSQCVREKNYIHIHRHIQICYVRSGTLHHTINGTEYIQEPGSCSVILPYTKHMVDSTQSEDTPVIIFISFFDDFLSGFGYRIFPFGGELASFENHTIPQFCQFSEKKLKTAQLYIQQMLDEFSPDKDFDFKIISDKIAALLRLMCTENSKRYNVSLSEERAKGIKRATEYIEKHYSKKISIDNLCPIAGMSRSTFTHNFKAITGLTVANFILSRRLSAAVFLIHNSDTLLDNIATKTGLHNRTNLTRVFRKYMGISPTELRENILKQKISKQKLMFSQYDWLTEPEGEDDDTTKNSTL